MKIFHFHINSKPTDRPSFLTGIQAPKSERIHLPTRPVNEITKLNARAKFLSGVWPEWLAKLLQFHRIFVNGKKGTAAILTELRHVQLRTPFQDRSIMADLDLAGARFFFWQKGGDIARNATRGDGAGSGQTTADRLPLTRDFSD